MARVLLPFNILDKKSKNQESYSNYNQHTHNTVGELGGRVVIVEIIQTPLDGAKFGMLVKLFIDGLIFSEINMSFLLSESVM